jgi:hypothetical protein
MTRKLVSTANITVRNLTEVPKTDVELRVVVTSTGSLEMLPLLAPPLAGWSYRTDPSYPTGGYFYKVLGDLAAGIPPQSGDTFLDQLRFSYATNVRFTYAVQVWGKY